MTKHFILIASLFFSSLPILADETTTPTPKIVCGAHLNDEAIALVANPMVEGYFSGYSKDLTAMIHVLIDLSRNRAELHLTETLVDSDYYELKAKLNGSNSETLLGLLKRRDNKIVMGFYNDFIDYQTQQAGRSLSISCAKK